MDSRRLSRRAVLGGAAGAVAAGAGWLVSRRGGNAGGGPDLATASGPTSAPSPPPPPSAGAPTSSQLPPAAPTSVPQATASPTTSTTGAPTASTTDPQPTTTASSSTSSPSTTELPAPPPTGTGSRDLIGRDGWGAAPAGAGLVAHTISRLTVHHTASAFTDNTKAPGRVRSFQTFHQDQGWPDLAYHHVIDRNGNVYEARPTSARGDTFTNYDPTGHYLVVCDGDFTQQTPTDAQVSALADMLAWASTRFGVAAATLGTHRDYAATACPGDGLGRLVDNGTLLAAVEARLAAGSTALRYLTGREALDRVTAIEAGAA